MLPVQIGVSAPATGSHAMPRCSSMAQPPPTHKVQKVPACHAAAACCYVVMATVMPAASLGAGLRSLRIKPTPLTEVLVAIVLR